MALGEEMDDYLHFLLLLHFTSVLIHSSMVHSITHHVRPFIKRLSFLVNAFFLFPSLHFTRVGTTAFLKSKGV